MSPNKLHALGNIFAGVFREPPISTKTDPAPATALDQPTHEEPTNQNKLHALDSMLTEVFREPPISTKTEPAPTTSFDQPTHEEPADQAAVDAPSEAGNPSIRAEQAKSLLAGLGLDTAIRLRWALRDIKAKRTKLTPVSPSDLKTLIEMGLAEMCDDAPMLTNEGHVAC